MAIQANYLGMPLDLDDLDVENLAYFKHCAAHDFHLQQCERLRPAALSADHGLSVVHEPEVAMGAGRGHGRRAFLHRGPSRHPAGLQGHTPYLILLVDLDTQKGKPTEHEALRVVGNLATPDGQLAPPEMVQRVGIGTRVRMVFADVAPGLALPHWTIDETPRSPTSPGAIRRSDAGKGRPADAIPARQASSIRGMPLRASCSAISVRRKKPSMDSSLIPCDT